VGGPVCKSKETRGFLCKTAKSRHGLTGGGGFDPRRMDLIRRIQIQRRRWHAGAGGGGRSAMSGGTRRRSRRRKAVLALGFPIYHGESTRTKSTSTRTQRGRRRGGGDGARHGEAVERGGATSTTPLRRCGGPGRQQATPSRSLPCSEAPGDLLGDGKAADGPLMAAAAALGFGGVAARARG
jgi:hypothetical protein